MVLKNNSFSPGDWNNNKDIKYSHNCYEYALNKISPENGVECKKMEKENKSCGYLKHQPGYASGFPKILNRKYTCKKMEKRIKGDNPLLYKTKKKCKKGFYKMGLVVRPNRRYHFYRKHADGTWSHKEGQTAATDKDASGKKITSLKDADRKYSDRYYSKICGEYCLPKGKYHRSSHTVVTKKKKSDKGKRKGLKKRVYTKRHNL